MAAAEALTAAGRLDQAARIAHDRLAKPLPPAAGTAAVRPGLGPGAGGQARDAAGQAQLAWPGRSCPATVRDQALTAHLQALAGLRDELVGPAADAVLAAPGQHDGHAAAAARLARAVSAWDSGQIGDGGRHAA